MGLVKILPYHLITKSEQSNPTLVKWEFFCNDNNTKCYQKLLTLKLWNEDQHNWETYDKVGDDV